MEIKIWNDFCVPHCYTGEIQLMKAIKQLGIEDKVNIKLKVFELDPTFPKGETIDVPECVAKKYGCSMEEGLEKIEYASMLGREAGIDMKFKTAIFCNTRDAHRVLKYVEAVYGDNVALDFNFVLFDAYFTRNLILDATALVTLAAENGINAEEARKVLETDMYLNEVLADEQEAFQSCINSIPCFIFNNKYLVQGSMHLDGFKQVLNDIINKIN